MSLKFAHVALVGKYQGPTAKAATEPARGLLTQIGEFLRRQGCAVTLDDNTAKATGITEFDVTDVESIGAHADL
jgi:NAD+ kinase